jgi:hypothetical protein
LTQTPPPERLRRDEAPPSAHPLSRPCSPHPPRAPATRLSRGSRQRGGNGSPKLTGRGTVPETHTRPPKWLTRDEVSRSSHIPDQTCSPHPPRVPATRLRHTGAQQRAGSGRKKKSRGAATRRKHLLPSGLGETRRPPQLIHWSDLALHTHRGSRQLV